MFDRILKSLSGARSERAIDAADTVGDLSVGAIGAGEPTLDNPQGPGGLPIRVAQLDAGDAPAANDAASVSLPPQLADATIREVLLSSPGAVISLPAGTAFNKVHAHNGDLFLEQPDGSVVVILNGAATFPSLQIGDATIPAEAIAQAFAGEPPSEDTGSQSSGGEFSVDPGDIGPPVDLTPLLPPTALAFGVAFEDPRIQDNDLPTVSIRVRVDEMVIVDETRGENPDEKDVGLGQVTVPGEQLFEVVIDFGGDGAGSVVYSLAVMGDGATGLETTERDPISLRQIDDGTVIGETPKGVKVFEITIDPAAGDVTLTLFESLHHYDPEDPDDRVALAEGVLKAVVTVTDGNGDSASDAADLGGGVVKFEDDAPRLTGEDVWRMVDEDDIATGLSKGTRPDDGDDKDGSFTGDPYAATGGPAVVFGSLSGVVHFGEDDPGAFAFTDGAVDDLAALGLRSKGELLSYEVVAGPDGWVLRAFVDQGGAPNAFDDGDRPVFSLALDAGNGDFVFKLFDQLDHDRGKGQNVDLQDDIKGDVRELDFGALIKASDADGDSVFLDGLLHIKIRDDVPELSGRKLKLTVDEDDINTAQSHGTSPNDGAADGSLTGNPPSDVTGPAIVSGQLGGLVKIGADEPAHFSFIKERHIRWELKKLGLSSKDEPLGYDVEGDVLYGFVESGPGAPDYSDGDRLVFKLTLQPNGAVVFELFDQLDHDPGKGQNFDLQDQVAGDGDVWSIDFGRFIKATDFDGDAVTLKGAFRVQMGLSRRRSGGCRAGS